MEGKILGINLDGSGGAIKTNDGVRYKFTPEEVKENLELRQNDIVDFEVDGQFAINIYLIKRGTNINVSEMSHKVTPLVSDIIAFIVSIFTNIKEKIIGLLGKIKKAKVKENSQVATKKINPQVFIKKNKKQLSIVAALMIVLFVGYLISQLLAKTPEELREEQKTIQDQIVQVQKKQTKILPSLVKKNMQEFESKFLPMINEYQKDKKFHDIIRRSRTVVLNNTRYNIQEAVEKLKSIKSSVTQEKYQNALTLVSSKFSKYGLDEKYLVKKIKSYVESEDKLTTFNTEEPEILKLTGRYYNSHQTLTQLYRSFGNDASRYKGSDENILAFQDEYKKVKLKFSTDVERLNEEFKDVTSNLFDSLRDDDNLIYVKQDLNVDRQNKIIYEKITGEKAEGKFLFLFANIQNTAVIEDGFIKTITDTNGTKIVFNKNLLDYADIKEEKDLKMYYMECFDDGLPEIIKFEDSRFTVNFEMEKEDGKLQLKKGDYDNKKTGEKFVFSSDGVKVYDSKSDNLKLTYAKGTRDYSLLKDIYVDRTIKNFSAEPEYFLEDVLKNM